MTLDLTAAIEAAAARLYADEHGGTTNVSSATLFAIVSDQMPPIAQSFRDRARHQIESAAPSGSEA